MLGTGISAGNKTQPRASGSSEGMGGRLEAGVVAMLGSDAITVWPCDWYKAWCWHATEEGAPNHVGMRDNGREVTRFCDPHPEILS